MRCGEVQPLADFGPARRNRDGRLGHCRPCGNAYARKRYHANLEHSRAVGRAGYYASKPRARARHLMHKYGLPEQWDSMLIEQRGRCASVRNR